MSEINTWWPTSSEDEPAIMPDGALLAAHNAGLVYGLSPEEQIRLEVILADKSEQAPLLQLTIKL